jgi:hypothetical protein
MKAYPGVAFVWLAYDNIVLLEIQLTAINLSKFAVRIIVSNI